MPKQALASEGRRARSRSVRLAQESPVRSGLPQEAVQLLKNGFPGNLRLHAEACSHSQNLAWPGDA